MKFLKFNGGVVFLLLLTFLPSPIFADYKITDSIEEFGEKRYVKTEPGRLKSGPIVWHPYIRNKASYDSNIVRQEGDPHDDVVFNIQPGAIVEVPFQQHQVTAGYNAEFEVFSKDKDAKQNAQNQDMFALADFHFSDFYANILEKYSETSSRSGTTFTERIPRRDQSINPKIGYRWKRTIFETGFTHFYRDFRRQIDDSLDFQYVQWSNVIYYDLFANLKALAEYTWGQLDYDDAASRQGSINQFRVGVEGEVFRNLILRARTGFQIRNYQYSSEQDFRSWVGKLSAEYRLRENVTLKTSMEREPIEATFQDVNFFLRHIIRFGAEYEFIPRWKLFSEAKVYYDRYKERAIAANHFGFRGDKHFGIETGLRYDFREWLQMELAYEFLHRDSNFPDFDYNDHIASLTSTLKY